MPVENTWLFPTTQRLLTPNRYRQGDPRVKAVDLFLFHYTAGVDAPLIPRLQRWNSINGGSSTHFAVARRPAETPTVQLACLEDRTWHAGKSAVWRGVTGVNVRSIGIDADNVGYLHKERGKWFNAYGAEYRGPDPFVDASGRGWEPYPEAQTNELCRLVFRLAEVFPIVRTDTDRLLPHSAVVPTKADTGPAFPWQEIKAAALGKLPNLIEV